jgi:hypothetical protein
MEFLGFRNYRDLSRLDRNSPQLQALTRFLKNIRIKVTNSRGERTKVIRGFVPRAGHFEFEKDGRPITIQVSDFYHRYFCVNSSGAGLLSAVPQ